MTAVPPPIQSSQHFSTISVDKALIGSLVGDLVANISSWKGTVRAATQANMTLSGLSTIDTSVALAAGDRVLVKAQTDASQNGIYQVYAGPWIRTMDMPAGSSAAGVAVFVSEGTVSSDKVYVCTTNSGSDVVGTNTLSFSVTTGVNPGVGTVNQLQVSDGASGVNASDVVAEAVGGSGSLTAPGTITSTSGNFVATAGGFRVATKTAVTQITSITTGVTAASAAGTITTVSATTASGATSTFTVTCAAALSGSKVFLQLVSYAGTKVTTIPVLSVSSVSAGSFNVAITNYGSASLDGVIVFSYFVVL